MLGIRRQALRDHLFGNANFLSDNPETAGAGRADQSPGLINMER
jgi:hypothetical protein